MLILTSATCATSRSGPQNYTRENILDHMHKFAYFGVAASMAMGSDFGDLPFRLRDETRAGKHPHAARFLTAGRGLAPIDEIKPNNMRHSAHLVTTEDDARKAVADLAANGVEMVKTWVDTRAARSRSSRRRSTRRSSTRRTSARCGSWCMPRASSTSRR